MSARGAIRMLDCLMCIPLTPMPLGSLSEQYPEPATNGLLDNEY